MSEVKTVRDHATPLILSVKFNANEIFNYLLDKNTDVHALDSHGNSALHYAV